MNKVILLSWYFDPYMCYSFNFPKILKIKKIGLFPQLLKKFPCSGKKEKVGKIQFHPDLLLFWSPNLRKSQKFCEGHAHRFPLFFRLLLLLLSFFLLLIKKHIFFVLVLLFAQIERFIDLLYA